jgi:ABC-type transport system substrate-binding protein
MKSLQPAIAFLVIFLATAICCGGTDGGGSTGNGGITSEPEQPIGNISAVRTTVEAGRYGIVDEVSGSRDLFNDESVHVRDNGKGQINFNDGSAITLYNNTSANQVVAQVSPPEVRLLLTDQGFQGYVPQGNKFTVDMPNGSQVTILGTQFFVLYDASSGYSAVGNFDGTVLFTPPGGTEQQLSIQSMVDISPTGDTLFQELRYSPGEFDSAAEQFGSPVTGLQTLRDAFKQQPLGVPSGTEPIGPTQPPAQPNTVIRHLVTSQNGSITPDLATDWNVDPDGYIVIFHLRSGVFLPDGSPFTSSFVRDQLSKNWPYALEGNVNFEVIDDFTISFQLKSPSAGYVLDEMSKFDFEVLSDPIIN